MPVIETTLIEGYDDQTKMRLMKGMARVVRSVIAAVPDGTITVIREVSPSSYARGGISRIPGPPVPPAIDTVSNFLSALSNGDEAKAAEMISPDFTAFDEAGHSTSLAALIARRGGYQPSQFDESINDDTVVVFAAGTTSSKRVMERLAINGRVISKYEVWAS